MNTSIAKYAKTVSKQKLNQLVTDGTYPQPTFQLTSAHQSFEYPEFVERNKLYLHFGNYLELIIRRILVKNNQRQGPSEYSTILSSPPIPIDDYNKVVSATSFAPGIGLKYNLASVEEVTRFTDSPAYASIPQVDKVHMSFIKDAAVNHQSCINYHLRLGKNNLYTESFITSGKTAVDWNHFERLLDCALSFESNQPTFDIQKDLWYMAGINNEKWFFSETPKYSECSEDHPISQEMISAMTEYLEQRYQGQKLYVDYKLYGKGCLGYADVIIGDELIDIKVSKSDSDVTPAQVAQLYCYAALAKIRGITVNKVTIYNPLKGSVRSMSLPITFDGDKDLSSREIQHVQRSSEQKSKTYR